MKKLLKKIMIRLDEAERVEDIVRVSEKTDRYRVDVMKEAERKPEPPQETRLDRLKRELTEKARAKGACQEGLYCISLATSIDDLLLATIKYFHWGVRNGILTTNYYDDNYTQEELCRVKIFTRGKHKLNSGVAFFLGNSKVDASGKSHVHAYDNSHVHASDNSYVWAYGNNYVWAHDNSHVHASGNSYVWAYGNNYVWAHDNSHVWVYGNNYVHASGNSRVHALGNRRVHVLGDSEVHVFKKEKQ